ncbi:hypothetical protein RBH94_06215 [Aestuariibaculum sp. YM273]|uniref:hypothetical protein n=1 Tax=Aestuariibaculum sp. YM273 TaxID=3070659 RepID=UPI0027DCE191|nr:hypothetical protein [Aestuariibaculum sp. YM273]WMI66756.1 hypothetical protein RBH94_06215 [Aestuariibaculum sp. YM273]
MKEKTYFRWILILAVLLFGLLYVVRHADAFRSHEFIDVDYESKVVSEGESCLQCHQQTKGFSEYHNPELIGCANCHLGNTEALNKAEAHKGMVLIPGNLVDAQRTCGTCHANELHNVEHSLMTTNSGLVAVDKFVFGESDSLNAHYHIKDLQYSAADKHLRDLCANCHLGAQKTDYGPITQLSRGGGCNACHLNYSQQAKADLNTYIASNKIQLPKVHPSSDVFMNDTHCFGCHSRSSRISTNYIGLQETLLDEAEEGHVVLEDKRVYKQLQEDVHHTKGLLCIDCHSSHEVMGDGKTYAHAEDAVTLKCSDCHFKSKPRTVPFDSIDRESRLVYLHRGYEHHDKDVLVVEKDGHPLINNYIDSLGNAFLIGKKDQKLHPLAPQSEVCSRDNAHKNVSCSACHSSWTPRCIGCHNKFDGNEPQAFDLLDKKLVKGQWKEYVAEFSASLPALGVREHEEGNIIEAAIPGMVMTIDKGSYSGHPDTDVSFHRLFAPNAPHTTTKEVRDCKSCHADPYALGYGNGDLVYHIDKEKGEWIFTPEYALNPNDGLPEDAWIPFMKHGNGQALTSTRTNFRPFNVEEQQRLLFVGACLQCHSDTSRVMQQTLEDGLQASLKRLSKACILPE